MPIIIELHNVPIFLFFCGLAIASWFVTNTLPKIIKKAVRKWLA